LTRFEAFLFGFGEIVLPSTSEAGKGDIVTVFFDLRAAAE
jgi:hypothetical protein